MTLQGMYGKAFESMYSGSMVGAGLNVFAVWNYVIAKTYGGVIELNPKLIAAILGGAEKEIVSAIEFLCQPDEDSRCKEEGGRRMIREGQFQYRVVNWAEYQTIKNEAGLKEYNRRKQAEYRARKRAEALAKKKSKPFAGEQSYVKALEAGASQEQLDAMSNPQEGR